MPPSEPSPFIIIPILLGFAVVLPLMWTGVIGLIALLGGWTRLSGSFRATTSPRGKRHSGLSGRFGIANYKFTLAVTVAEEGLYFEVHSLFRPFHPPLLIPWDQVYNVKPIESGYLFFVGMRSSLDVGSPRLAHVTLSLPVKELQPPGTG